MKTFLIASSGAKESTTTHRNQNQMASHSQNVSIREKVNTLRRKMCPIFIVQSSLAKKSAFETPVLDTRKSRSLLCEREGGVNARSVAHIFRSGRSLVRTAIQVSCNRVIKGLQQTNTNFFGEKTHWHNLRDQCLRLVVSMASDRLIAFQFVSS